MNHPIYWETIGKIILGIIMYCFLMGGMLYFLDLFFPEKPKQTEYCIQRSYMNGDYVRACSPLGRERAEEMFNNK